MRFLILCAYLCAIGAFAAWGVIVFQTFDDVQTLNDENIFLLLFMLPAIFQFVYVWKTSPFINLPHYKTTESLDDFALNDIEHDGGIVGNGFWLKAFCTINSILLCGFFLGFTYAMPFVLRSPFGDDIDFLDHLFTWILLGVYLVTVPTIIYNLRTFNLKRVLNPTKGD